VKISEEELRKITLTAINELGDKASPELVRNIVSSAVDKLGAETELPKTESAVVVDRAILTSFGLNRPGVIARITALLAEAGCDLRDVSQKIMDDFYTLIMIVDLSSSKYQLKELSEKLEKIASEMNVKIFLQHENLFRQMHRI
jgi:ACT domain-containing protein